MQICYAFSATHAGDQPSVLYCTLFCTRISNMRAATSFTVEKLGKAASPAAVAYPVCSPACEIVPLPACCCGFCRKLGDMRNFCCSLYLLNNINRFLPISSNIFMEQAFMGLLQVQEEPGCKVYWASIIKCR